MMFFATEPIDELAVPKVGENFQHPEYFEIACQAMLTMDCSKKNVVELRTIVVASFVILLVTTFIP